ncbi:MAG: class I SAM-dependent methyltransferase [Gammaproteobacteria bacterium]|jgi:predicted O-methyltransferase YrrM
MTITTLKLDDRVYDYIRRVSLREGEVLRRLREETAGYPNPNMQISPEQGQFMALLLGIMGAKRVIEVGVFTGYSSLWMAGALPEDGRIIACDVNKEYTNVARRYWEEAGVADRIELRLAPAIETLDSLIAAGETGIFDFVFLDALKTEYRDYYERALQLLRPGGVVAIDNTLWDGKVADPEIQDASTLALKELNGFLFRDERIDLSLLPVADGLTLCRKR